MDDHLPSGYVKIAIENDPVEIVSFPINSMVMFYSYVKLPEGKIISDHQKKRYTRPIQIKKNIGILKAKPKSRDINPSPIYGPQQNNRFSPKPGFRGWYLILGQGILHHSTIPNPPFLYKNKEESITVSSTIPPFVLNGGGSCLDGLRV